MKPKGQDTEIAAQKFALQQAQEKAAREQALYAQQKPYYDAMAALGIKPENFVNTSLGQSYKAALGAPISREFAASRNNMIEAGGASGQYGSGLMAGPINNNLIQEALANASVDQQLPQIAWNIGQQGLAGLAGQQQIANPLGWLTGTAQATSAIPRGGFGEAFSQAAGNMLGSSINKGGIFS